MTFINGPDQYRPIPPKDDRVVGGVLNDKGVQLHEGLFYYERPQTIESAVELTEALTERILAAPADASMQAYQYWSEAGWKTEHGTYSSADRFGEKAFEEHEELRVAMLGLSRCRPDEVELFRQQVLHELGDVAWCVNALSSNSSAALDSSMKNMLYSYVMGINHVVNGEDSKPRWRDYGAQLATKYELLTIGDIEELITAGFEPTESTAMNVYPDGNYDERDAEEHLTSLLMCLMNMRSLSEQQYGYGGEMDFGPVRIMIERSEYEDMSKIIGELAARAMLHVAFLSDRVLGQPLSAPIGHNVSVISQRISLNLIDKSDGPRPDALR